MGSEPKFAEPSARPQGAVLHIAAKLVSDPKNPLRCRIGPAAANESLPQRRGLARAWFIRARTRACALPACAVAGGVKGAARTIQVWLPRR